MPRLRSLKELDQQTISHSRSEKVSQFLGHEQTCRVVSEVRIPLRRTLLVSRASSGRLYDRKSPTAMPEVEADRDASKWFCLDHGGHSSKIAKSGCRPGLGKANGNILTLHLSPLEVR